MNCFMIQQPKPLTVVIAYHQGDHELVSGLLSWIIELGGCPNNECLLVADAGIDRAISSPMLYLAGKAFKKVGQTFNATPTPGWIAGSNSLFLTAAGWAYENKTQWLFLEPDATPLLPNWLSLVEEEYWACGQPYLAYRYEGEGANKGKKFMSGIAVYPHDALTHLHGPVSSQSTDGFDQVASKYVLKRCAPSKTIHHFWGMTNLPPIFVEDKQGAHPINTFTLANINPNAAIFHRCKDGSLITVLRKALAPNPMMVVYPFCNRDAQMAAKNMGWIAQLGHYDFDIVLSYERGTYPKAVDDITHMALESFRSVKTFDYPPPLGGQWAPTVAFKAAANHMMLYGRPWLWMEFDAIPLRADWLEVLQKAYYDGGKPFAGPIVPQLGHMNGTAIYPADTPRRYQSALCAMHTAWDTEARNEQEGQVKDLWGLYQHVWGVVGGNFHPFGGEPPSFSPNSHLLRQINSSAVIFHRCKDGTLIDRLREKMQ